MHLHPTTITFAIIMLLPTIVAANLRLQPPPGYSGPPESETVPKTEPMPTTEPIPTIIVTPDKDLNTPAAETPTPPPKPPVKPAMTRPKPPLIRPPVAPPLPPSESQTPATATAPPLARPTTPPTVTLLATGQPASIICQMKGGGFAVVGGDAPRANTIIMKNDGGWCGHLAKTVKGSLVFGAPCHVVVPPAHGVVSIKVEDKGTAIYYRPSPGYVGTDQFSILTEINNVERPYNVIVQ